MNTPKKSPSSWILCSSKSFPGKSYNFNVLTGEAVWTLSDHEKNNQKKNTNIQKVDDKLHNYPEPTTHPDNPPEVSTPNIWPTTPTPNHWQDYQRYAQYTPMVNQYMPMPNTVMMPIQWPAPLWPYVAQDAKPPTNDKITQTDRIERNLFVQTCGLPLCQRFINYETPSLNFDKENKVINKCIESPQHKNLNTKIELLESDLAVTQSIPKNILYKNTGCSIQELGEDNNYKGSLPTRSMANLDGTDLRFLLEAKKRKLHEESASIEKTQKHQVPINTKKVRFDLTTSNVNCDNDHKKHSNSIPSKESNTKPPHIPLSLPKTHTKDIPQNTTSTATIDMDNALTETGSHIEESDNTTIEIESYVPTRDVSMELNKMYSSNVRNEDIDGTGNSYKIKESVTMSERPALREFSSSYTVKDIWYIVADMNVLLDNYDIVDMILQRYESSRLLIPQRLRAEIDTLCVGDCRGQQRVLVARQISRRIVAAHKQYFLEPPPYKENDKVTTTDGILNCCMRAIKNSYYLVLITNDPCLLTRGRASNLRCYTVQEIKNGAIINPKSFSELRRLQVTLDNVDIDENNTFIKNKLSDIFSKIDKPIGNKLLAMDSDVKDDKKCDILINITKPKSRNINGNNAENDSVITNDISNQMKVLNITKCIDNSKHSYFSQTEIISENCSINRKSNSVKNHFESQNVSQNFKSSNIHSQSQESNKLIFDNHVQSKSKLDFEKPIFISSNSPSEHINNDIKQNEIVSQNTYSQNEKSTIVYSQRQTRNTSFNIKNTTNTIKMSKYIENLESLQRYQNEENIPSQNQNTDPQNEFQTYFSNVNKDLKSNDTEQNNVSQVKKTHDDKNKITILTTPAGHRLEKIINNINLKSNIDSPNEENDETFEVTKVLTLKKGTIVTSTPKQVTGATDQIRSNFKKSDWCIDDSLKRFYLKNKMMVNNIRSSMDEWICTYTQIMEELLRDVLQLNCEYTNKTIASPITLHETLTCIKMLHDNMELKNIITVLVELLTKYSCSKGKLNLDTKPQEFIKIVGCGFLLLKTLKTLYPVSDMFTEYEKYFDTLLSNMECTRTDLDPELLPPMNVCRSEMSQANTDTRLNYRKERSYIVAYLKKHYKEWSAYDENAHRPDTQLKTNNEDIKVLRIIGKNLNMLKIDNNKSISYINSDEKQCSTDNDETKIIRLLDNKQTNAKTTNVCIIENKYAVSELRRNVFKEKFLQINDQSSIDAEPKLMKNTDNIDPNINKQDNNKVFIESDVITKPKAMNNDNNIETVKDKEPLDLDMLDFSDVVTVTVDGHSEKSKENYELLSMDIENSDYYNVLNQKHPIDEIYATNDDIYASRNDDQREDSIILRSHNKMTTVDKDYATKCDLSLKEKQNKIVLENIIIQEDDESVNIQEIYGSRNNNASNLNYATENRRFDENYANSNIDLSSNDEETMCMDYVTSFGKDVSRVVDENYAKNSVNYAICDNNYAKNSENYAIYDGNYKNGGNHAICDGNYAKNGENCADNQMTAQDSKNDSGFENMSAQAYDVIKVFLTVLNVTFKYVYDFISKVVKDLNEKSLCEERKKIVHLKASQCLQEMVAVIKELKSIIKRESQEVTTLKKLLLNAGEDAMTDRRATRYRQNVSKYLEQAETLAGALRAVINITVGDTIPSNAGTVCSSERCNNIFE